MNPRYADILRGVLDDGDVETLQRRTAQRQADALAAMLAAGTSLLSTAVRRGSQDSAADYRQARRGAAAGDASSAASSVAAPGRPFALDAASASHRQHPTAHQAQHQASPAALGEPAAVQRPGLGG